MKDKQHKQKIAQLEKAIEDGKGYVLGVAQFSAKGSTQRLVSFTASELACM